MCSKTNSQHFLPMRPTQSASIMAYTSPLFSSAAVIEETEAEQLLSDICLSGPNARWQISVNASHCRYRSHGVVGGQPSLVSVRERMIIRSVSYRNRYWVYHIELATVVSADITCITAGSAAAVNRSHCTADQMTFAPRHLQRTHRTWSKIRERVGGPGGGRL